MWKKIREAFPDTEVVLARKWESWMEVNNGNGSREIKSAVRRVASN
jgi:hypothetical protein